jgi:hypothetical protein
MRLELDPANEFCQLATSAKVRLRRASDLPSHQRHVRAAEHWRFWPQSGVQDGSPMRVSESGPPTGSPTAAVVGHESRVDRLSAGRRTSSDTKNPAPSTIGTGFQSWSSGSDTVARDSPGLRAPSTWVQTGAVSMPRRR